MGEPVRPGDLVVPQGDRRRERKGLDVLGVADAVPGLAEFTQSVIHVDEAERALAAYREFVRHPGPIVIGAAPGASVLGPIYEYAFLVDADLKRRNIRERVPITLVTPEPWPGHLGLGSEGASRGAVTAALVDTKISVICNARTVRIDQDTIHVVELDTTGNEKRTHDLPYAYSVYWPAFGGVPGVRSATGLVNAHGLVVVEKWVEGKAPFQVLWEAMDAGDFRVANTIPQGPLEYVPSDGGRRVLRTD